MSIASALAACRSEILSFVKSVVRLLQWTVLIMILVLAASILRPPLDIFSVQTCVAFGLILFSLLAIGLLAGSQTPDRKTWVGVYAGIATVGVASVFWAPKWSGYIAGFPFVLFGLVPNVLFRLARRRAAAGYERAAAFYARLSCLFHPSAPVRFETSFLIARALGSIEEKIAAYRALVPRATPEQFVLLNCSIAADRDDWEGVLGQLRSSGNRTDPKWLEIRALGELGRLEEMLRTYASAEPILTANDLRFCRLYVLAHSGRADSVRLLLSTQLRFVRARNKAYWIFIANTAAGGYGEEARLALASHVGPDADETFRRIAQRHLDAAPTLCGATLSAESRGTIAAIETTLQQA
jgi:hypothetical protein